MPLGGSLFLRRNLPQIFNYGKQQVRTVVRAGEPWFVAKDVAEVLGYSDVAYAIRTHCKSSEVLKHEESSSLTSSPRGITIIPERDLYRLIMRSKLPSAECFEEWVVGEVLPQIRKTGSYVKPMSQLEMMEVQLKQLIEQERRVSQKIPWQLQC